MLPKPKVLYVRRATKMRDILSTVAKRDAHEVLSEIVRHEGEEPGNLIHNARRVRDFYFGYKRSYEKLQAEIGQFRSTTAPYVRPEEQAERHRDEPSIFLVTLPKSATVHIGHSIAQSLRYNHTHTLVTPTFPKNIVWPEMARDFVRGGMISASHMEADSRNLIILRQSNVRRIVLHVRDPRAALLSWVHFMAKRGRNRDFQAGVGSIPNQHTIDFSRKDFEEQVNGCIQTFYQNCIGWLNRWMETLDRNDIFEFLVIRHEEFVSNEQEYYNRILDFYDIKGAINSVKSGETTHFRSGNNDEWREAFTSEQIENVNRLLPQIICDRFGWTK